MMDKIDKEDNKYQNKTEELFDDNNEELLDDNDDIKLEVEDIDFSMNQGQVNHYFKEETGEKETSRGNSFFKVILF